MKALHRFPHMALDQLGRITAEVAGLEGDRFLAPDLAAAEQVVTSGALVTAVEKKVGPLAV